MLTGFPDSALRGVQTRRGLLRCLACFALLPWPLRAARAADRGAFRIVANAANRESKLSRDFLTQAFLKKVSRWRDGEAILPVDLPSSSTTRKAFSEAVLNRSVEAVRAYWQQRIFSGRGVPPPELAGDEEVLQYVRKYRGAIGYVSASASLQEVKVIEPD